MTTATIIIPTHDHALMLPMAIESARQQTVEDISIVVIGDGVGDDTRSVMQGAVAEDARVTFLDRPKSGRTGELHRHEAMQGITNGLVTYLSDDDLFLPEHVEVMLAALREAHFAHPFPAHVDRHGTIHSDPLDLAVPAMAALEFRASLVSLTGLAHTAEGYHRLPYGWRSTPAGTYTDQYMAQQFLAQPWCIATVASEVTLVRFPSVERTDMTAEQRHAELAAWRDRLVDSDGRASYRAATMRAHLRSAVEWRARAIATDERNGELHRLVGELHERQGATDARLAEADQRAATADQHAASALQRAASADLHAADLTQRLHATQVQADHERSARAAAETLLDARSAEHDAVLTGLADAHRELEGARDLATRLVELEATRAVRVRNRLVRSRVLRALLARRRVTH